MHSSSPSTDPEGGAASPPSTLRPPSHPYASLYRRSLSLLTDLYEITMAYGFFREGMAEREAVFVHSFRANPFGGGYTVACGLAPLAELLDGFRFERDDLDFLATLRGRDGEPLFADDFLAHLRDFRFRCDVDAVPEGTVVFPYEPLVRVRGPLLQAQLLESTLLNVINFQTLVATKAARVTEAAAGDPVLEFGLRRAQGIDGAISASRAAFVGGCAATSNVLAGRLFGIPVAGTQAHSWIMSFEEELRAFDAFAEAFPGNCVLLVDTYDTLQGVRHAVEVGRRLRARGYELLGIRLDSGDLAYLSTEARRILDEGGLPEATIYASNDLDERLIESLKQQGARIGSWGVGTKLVTAAEEPALGGTYKLSALRAPDGGWRPKVKLSEQSAKISIPGLLQVRRFHRGGEFVGDMIHDESRARCSAIAIDPLDPTRRKRFSADLEREDLLVPVYRGGSRVLELPSLPAVRQRVRDQLGRLHPGIRRFVNPHRYPAGLESGLHRQRAELVLRARGFD
jgi:nicotinate phosphoribosyltransferase